MIVLSCVMFACLIYNTVILPSQYRQSIIRTDEYMAYQADAAELERYGPGGERGIREEEKKL